MTLDEITSCFFEYALQQGKPYKNFPLGTDIEEFGAPYIEISTSGKAAIVARDRGEECLRRETNSPKVLAQWDFEMFNRR
ncbi:hypothetical protein [Pseudooceanicola antarcticus]|uniref:Uncharacterized protein n=1 Tax=Pseudooceanicola antarcticus TaxID=1247613 RepID=A0ABX4MQR8_9RHOB|nr:hypothetical protein [Pseudooceanicola antarcticus]PJE30339.1 hypothetical protein CVM39_06420 [Pseudooceanicola antarcticus]